MLVVVENFFAMLVVDLVAKYYQAATGLDVRRLLITSTSVRSALERRGRISAWRGIGWGSSCYARECFIDELAAAAGTDPVGLRRKLLADSRLRPGG